MQKGDVSSPAHGAYADLEQLIGLRFPAQKLQLLHRNRALAALTGPNKSNVRGRGIDFEEVRSYQAGDDIRSIDWRVTARTGDAHTKLFREERERPVLLVLDQRQGMFFGSSHCFKSVLACHIAALLAWAALSGGDKVGGLVFNAIDHREIRPRRSRRTVLALLSEFCRYNGALPLAEQDPGGDLGGTLAQVRRIARPGSSIFLVSDFAGIRSEGTREHLYQLARHCQLTAINCTDPLESELPRAGHYAVTDGVGRTSLNTADSRLREAYRTAYQQQQLTLAAIMRPLGIPVLTAATNTSPFLLLQTYYADRQR
jgi:uncharacterized protein (DUF58 family)